MGNLEIGQEVGSSAESTAAASKQFKGSLGMYFPSARMGTARVIFLSLIFASCASHLLGYWLDISRDPDGTLGIYRRVGPETGPQAFCAGSSLLVSALSWSQVSDALGEGVETWGIGGSSPDIWEIWQQHRPRSNVTIIGISVYDLNEMHLADERATVVPLPRTIKDLWASHADPALSHRILTQYGLRYVRLLFPTAGKTEKVLIGLRSKGAKMMGRDHLAESENVVFQPAPPLLDAGVDMTSIRGWSSARLLRRIAALRSENHGRDEFLKGPKHRAFLRLLLQARRQGRVVVVVLPVSRWYSEAFLTESDSTAFETAIREATAIVPGTTLVRLDRVPGISDPGYFGDLVHMNSLGRRLATEELLKEIAQAGSQRFSNAMPSLSTTWDNPL